MSAGRKRTSRAEREAALVARARAVAVVDADVVVVGGGASGLVAGIVCAEAGASVVVLERALECGRTILATGGGRCNLANAELAPERYNDPDFVSAVAGPRFLDDVLAFFDECGLGVEREDEGRLYPVTREASSVREVLLARAERSGVVLACGREVRSLMPRGDGWVISYQETFGERRAHETRARSVVLASGGGTSALVRDLGVACVDERPALCPLACRPCAPCERLDFSALDGRRSQVRATLVRAGKVLASEEGELLFRPYGISGIVTFDLSRRAAAGDVIELDFLPHLSADEARRLVLNARGSTAGILDSALANELSRGGNDVVEQAKHLRLEVLGTADETHAQITAGGVSTSALDPHTLMATAAPGLFACGEAVDVDGDCGGFNLAWAWKSGIVAGISAAGHGEAGA